MEKRRKMKHIQPSSSRRETTPENHTALTKKPIGCMSGILQLLSRRHSRRRISSGSGRREKTEAHPAPSSRPTSPQPDLRNIKTAPPAADAGLKFPCEGDGLSQRSPTLSPEIRKSGCFDRGGSPRRPPALVARLMGLEEASPQQEKLPKAPPPAVGFSPESAEEKRRKLLGALERCDEDLRALKRIIDAVRAAEMKSVNGERGSPMEDLKCLDGNAEQPSPVSVLNGLSSPKNEDLGKKPRSAAEAISGHLRRRITVEETRRPPSDHKRILKDQRRPAEYSPAAAAAAATKSVNGGRWRWRWRRSEAMVESVDEVAEDAVCEERREAVRVGVDLADDVVGDLVGQLVVELVESCSKLCLLQTIRCKRKLGF